MAASSGTKTDGDAPAWVTLWGAPDHPCLPKRPDPQFVECGGAGGAHKVAYFVYEPPSEAAGKAPVVCAHSLTRNSFDYHWLAERLAALGHRVLCFDTAGRGASEPLQDVSAYGYPQYCADIVTLLKHVGWDSFHWIGTSMGGLQGMLLSASPPDASGWRGDFLSLTLVDIGPYVDKEAIDAIKAYVGAPLPGGPRLAGLDGGKAYVQKTFPGMLPVPSEERLQQCAAFVTRPNPVSCTPGTPPPADTDDSAERAPAYDARIKVALDATPSSAVDLWAVWGAVTSGRVLVLHGEESRILTKATLEEMQARVPPGVGAGSIQAVTFAGVGHAPTLWSKEQEDVVVSFLRE